MSQTLVLFDVDGTLLVTGGASSRCIRRAAERVLGPDFRWGPLTVGTLDPQIFRELASNCGITTTGEQLETYKALYLAELEVELRDRRQDVRVMPGVREVLKGLKARQDVTVGLLTGNFRRAVALKLRAAGLDEAEFPVGAFAEDGAVRSDLVPAAIARFMDWRSGILNTGRVVLVGDTPRDITCAREAGCRVLAVATGRYSLEELKSHNPDRAVSTLEDCGPLYSMIEEASRA